MVVQHQRNPPALLETPPLLFGDRLRLEISALPWEFSRLVFQGNSTPRAHHSSPCPPGDTVPSAGDTDPGLALDAPAALSEVSACLACGQGLLLQD